MYYFLDNPIGRDGAEIIAHYLKQNNSLEKLNLSFCDIDDQGAIAIVNSLQNNSTLKELSFGGKLFIYSFIHYFNFNSLKYLCLFLYRQSINRQINPSYF